MSLPHQPYPYNHSTKVLYKLASVSFIIVFLFLWLFEPFHVNTDEQKLGYWLICFIHAITPSLIYIIYFLLFNLVTPITSYEHWTVGKEIAHLAVLFFLIGVSSFLVRDVIYTNPDNWSWRYFIEEIKNTFLSGTLISTMLILIDFYRLNSNTQKQAKIVNNHLIYTETIVSDEISIKALVKSDDFVLVLNHFLFARAEGNYVEIFYTTIDTVKKDLKRISLSNLEAQLSVHPHLFRCHRAYLVNINNIREVTGNAQGYQLTFTGTTEQAYVSRKNLIQFNKLLK
jgi:LytTr DNA-binding domain